MTPELKNKIDDFLSEKRESHGDYAEITQQDVNQLNEIVHMLVEEKCDPDPDGDYPIDIHLVNRVRFEPVQFFLIPYRHHLRDKNDEEGLEERFNKLLFNLSSVMSKVESELKIRQFDRSEKLRKKKKSS